MVVSMKVRNNYERRRRRVLGFGILVLCMGMLYGIFVSRTGIAIPCLFRLVTNFKCPGCGVTQMCVALLQLDFKEAFHCNQMLFLLLPLLGAVFLKYIVDYVKTGLWHMGRLQNGIIYVSIALLLAFAVFRNIYNGL